jgi:mersacidin/lichenicidin family type 2 lantibiotic
MSHLDVIRAWKDEEYRLSLSEAERALLPAHPAGFIGLTDVEMYAIGGGDGTNSTVTSDGEVCCSGGCQGDMSCQCPGDGDGGGSGGGGNPLSTLQLYGEPVWCW